LPTIANVGARDFKDLACWLIVQIGPISLNVTTPSLGLAPNLVQTMLDTIESIKKSGITIMLVEQNTSQLEKFIDRVYVLEEGKNAGESSIEALRQQATRV